MSLTLALNNALSGMNVAQRSLAVLSNNVANANTPGYSRQVAELSPQVAGSQGSGVRLEQIVRKVDAYLNRAVQGQTSAVGSTGVVSDYMARIQIMTGQPGSTNSLDEYVENFFNIVQSLAESPELSSFRYQAVNAGQILAREMSTLAEGLEDLRYQADQDVQNTVTSLNDEILRLREANLSIYRATAMGDSTAPFLDQRDLSLKKIADIVDIRVNEHENGEVYVYTSSGTALLEHIPYQVKYTGANSLDTFVEDGMLPPITVDGLRDNGQSLGRPEQIVSSGVNKDITTVLRSGKLKGYLDIRDREIPAMLEQLDEIAAKLRDNMNDIHNSGSGFPPASKLTGSRPIGFDDRLEWTGTARIAVLDEDGTAVNSRYNNSSAGYLALDLDFDALQSQYGDLLSAQDIVDEINTHFLPQNKAAVGNLSNISMAAISNSIAPGGSFTFDLELENTSATPGNLWVQNVQVFNDAAVNVTSVTSTYPTQFSLNAANTFTTTAGSNKVTVAATGHGMAAGDVVYMNGVAGDGTDVDGIPIAEFNGQAFRITNVTANTFDIELVSSALTGIGPFNEAAATGLEAYASQAPGTKTRTGGNGDITLNLPVGASAYYVVRANVMVEDENGNLSTATVEYRVANNQTGTINDRYPARAVTAGTGTSALVVPNSHQPLLVASLVDAEGNPATPEEKAYLQIAAQNEPGSATKKYTVAIDDRSSKEIGRPNDNPAQAGSNRGFSHYFGLNDFFQANVPNSTGDTTAGSALALKVRQDIVDNPNLISMGTLTRTPNNTVGGGRAPDFSYERTTGENSVAQRMAKLGLEQLRFEAAGGLPTTVKSFNSYTSEVLGFTAGRAASAESQYTDETTLLAGFQERVESVSGVNIDEEMANTIIFQNAYSASAQVIKTVKELFDSLMASF